MDVHTRPLEEQQVVEVEGPPDGTESSAALLRAAIDEARDLVRLEVELARHELKEEVLRVKVGALALGGAAVLAMAGFTLLLATIAFAAGRSWLCALLMGAGLVLGAGGLAFVGWKAMPLSPLPATRERVEAGLRSLKERIE